MGAKGVLNPAKVGVRIAGTGSYVPPTRLTNADLEKMMDTNDEWIVQRTGIHERRRIVREKGESTYVLAAEALKAALADARMDVKELDMIIVATMTAEMTCPATACLVANAVQAGHCGTMDLNAACSGFVYAINVAHDLIKCGSYRSVAVIGADTLSELMDYSDNGRGTAIIFGDGAGAAILRATDDTSKGIVAQAMHSDGTGWKEIYVPRCAQDFPKDVAFAENKLNVVQMSGATVFKFAVGTFPKLIEETLEMAGLTAEQIDMYLCHQSNLRILHAARDRFGLPPEKLHINIDKYGNTVAATIPLCLDECRKIGTVRDGHKILMVAFGGGLTWASSLWQL
jgi:3-oxoacyl-[acyl-carrier-protein] synthase-3